MHWLSKSGKVFSPMLQSRLDHYFDRVLVYYPDYRIEQFCAKYKKLSGRAPELKRLAGYGVENRDFFEDFGFTYIAQRRKRNPVREPLEDLMARLKRTFPNRIKKHREMGDDYVRVLYYARRRSMTATQLLMQYDLLDPTLSHGNVRMSKLMAK